MSPPFRLLRSMRASDGVILRYASRCLDSYESRLVNVGRSLWVRVKKINNGIGSQVLVVDKDVDLELAMFACLIIYGVFILYKLTRLFWPNTCVVSMCITGASGAANKQV